MASQVFSENNQSSFTYTNNTGQNVRVIINYLNISPNNSLTRSSRRGTISVGRLQIDTGYNLPAVIGRNLGFYRSGTAVGNNAYTESTGEGTSTPVVPGLPTEVMLAPGEVFSIVGGITVSYNIVVIPENG